MTGLDAGYWTGLDEGELRLLRCPACRRWVWPAEPLCGDCGRFDLAWESVDMVGTVYSWTRTYYPFVPERSHQLPYVVVLVELPQAGYARLLGVLEGDTVATGDRVVGHIQPPRDETFGLPSVTWRVVVR